ncbi:DAK2 domain-containing protein [Weissella paramesenteroides]|uniref:DAK2 domain-containing protein n=1 Tax=Weissella paramesenteroides TaxID=1249 RepID=UPI00123C1069|nr:DAK2 domain-containing protein [Weissella paramesenteroides]KAA8439095.1 DAK2 domain-containing protein [Weissella paramesenteroides]KAA8440197.1 DAK2 domain-containing protein [Weissella paramesenteroides]KAA8443892.1 DAK2 domain-containing protein [Weissella paramesenteroides]KAA8448883.1 DAK2 domain-containing protein [Weissella paramesenteroides]KAA8451443.1 DAK2 domain-containing protein [Weissella paramesenteroides]
MEVVTTITNVEFGKMINAAADALKNNAEKINKLNVFPVPDGDTGTNMTLSMASGAEYERNEDDTHLGKLAQATAKGLLMGARGNSGVILSQIFRGFAAKITDKETLSARDLADALMGGAETAYKAVMKPTEGTILTVIRESAAAANRTAKKTDDATQVMADALDAAEKALASTPDLLPVLKEVGVVDSGGQGLVIVLSAFYAVLSGQEVKTELDNANLDAMVLSLHNAGVQGELNPEDIEYGYCTEIMVDIAKGTTYDQKFDYDTFYNHLAGLGDSLLVINDDDVVKVHVHTEDPGDVINWGTHFGSLRKVKVDNMRDQQAEAASVAAEQKAHAVDEENGAGPDLAVITTAAGKGIQEIFASAGATVIIDSKQAPSTQDLLQAIKDSHAAAAIILPNDGNIFMAAEQAVSLADVPVKVVKTKTIQQGLTALVLGYDQLKSLDENEAAMSAMIAEVKSGSVTTSVRDTTINGLAIQAGDAIGLLNGEIVVAVPDANIDQAASELLVKMIDEDSELVTIYYGEDSSLSAAETLQTAGEALDDELEFEIHDGGQPLYPILLSVE